VCGVIGLLLRDPLLEPRLGSLLVPMLEALDERGPDSSGIAVYTDREVDDPLGATAPDTTTVRLSLGADEPVDWVTLRCALLDLCPSGSDVHRFGAGAVVDVPEWALEQVETALAERWPVVRVLGTGWNLRVLKDTGRPTDTCERYGVREWQGYLAIAHTRMATESAVTVLHSHPFVPDRDLCVVHNGSFSNYATVRRRLQDEGIVFDSDNDSEVGARFLAMRLAQGDDLEEATRWVMKEMDGFFTLVVTSGEGMSVVRDAFACKPAVVAETPGYVAVASEYRALAELPGITEAAVFEPHPEEVYTWTR
jgi:methylamine---glutamate N-methyltransferase subunit A